MDAETFDLIPAACAQMESALGEGVSAFRAILEGEMIAGPVADEIRLAMYAMVTAGMTLTALRYSMTGSAR